MACAVPRVRGGGGPLRVCAGCRDRRAPPAPAAPGGGTHVDLFIARDPSAARRARAIYEDPRGPTVHLAEMGAILGYPACCVAAFAALADRSNNTAIRYAAWARTVALGAAFEPALNNLFAHVVPFFPCSYACPSGRRRRVPCWTPWRGRPRGGGGAARRLARPVLYIDHARQVVFDGARRERGRGRGAAVPRGAGRGRAVRDAAGPWPRASSPRRRRCSPGATALREEPGAFTVLAGERVVARLARRPPGLGLLFPFGV